MSAEAYAGVWRPGTGAQWWRSGMSLDELKVQDKTYFDKGLRLVALAIRAGKYAAVWRPGTGAQWWKPGMSCDEFKAQDKAYFDQGLRLAVLEIEGGKYTAVWRPGTGAQWWHSHLCFDEFKTEDTAYFKMGLRLEMLELHDDPVAIYKLPFDDDSDWKLFNGNFDDPISGHPDTGLPYGNNQKYAFDFAHDYNNNGIGEGDRMCGPPEAERCMRSRTPRKETAGPVGLGKKPSSVLVHTQPATTVWAIS